MWKKTDSLRFGEDGLEWVETILSQEKGHVIINVAGIRRESQVLLGCLVAKVIFGERWIYSTGRIY